MSGAGSSVYDDYGNPAEKESGMAAYADFGVVDLRETLIRLEHQVKRFIREIANHQVASQGDYC